MWSDSILSPICQSIIALKSEHRCMWRHECHVWSYFRPAVHLWFNHRWQMSIQDWMSVFDNDPFWAVSLKLLEGILVTNIAILDKKEGKKLLQQPTIQCTFCIGRITVVIFSTVVEKIHKQTKRDKKQTEWLEILAGLLMGIVSYWISLQLTEPLTDFQATRGNTGAHFFFSFAVPKQFQPEMRFTVALTALVVVGWVHHVTQADWSAKLMFPLDSLNLPRGTAALQKHVRTNIMLQESVCIFKAWMNYTQKNTCLI